MKSQKSKTMKPQGVLSLLAKGAAALAVILGLLLVTADMNPFHAGGFILMKAAAFGLMWAGGYALTKLYGWEDTEDADV